MRFTSHFRIAHGEFNHLPRLLWFIFVIGSISVQAQSIEQVLRERVNSERNQTSIVVAVVDEKGTRFFSYGKTAKQPHAGNSNENTVFEIGSLTKVFTGILLAEAVKRGEVRLEDSISKHLPENVTSPKYNGKEITLLHLISHTSGLPFKPDNLSPNDYENPYAQYTVKQMYEFLAKYQLTHEPGSDFAYSNLGVGLLGHILSLRANTTYENLVETRILKPLGMNDTAITLTPRMKANLAVGYNEDGDQTSNWDLPTLAGAGALRSTAADMARFISANLGFTTTSISPSLAEAQKLVWVIKQPSKTILWHGGSTGGYLSFVAIDTAQKKGVFVATNSQDSIDDIGFHIIDNSSPLKQIAEAKKQITLSEEILERYVGEYHLSTLNLTFTISRKGQRLFLQQAGQAKFGLFPEKETEFFLRVVDASITFTKDEDGKVNGLILHQKGDHPGKRVK